MHVNTNDVVISQSNSIAYNKSFTKILRIFHIIAIWGLVLTGQTMLMSPKGRNACSDGLVKSWERDFIICNTITL